MSIFGNVSNFFKKKQTAEAKQKPMSIEEAGNFLKEKHDKGILKTVQEDTKDFQPSVASEQDRERYLNTVNEMLQTVSSDIIRKLPNKVISAHGLSATGVVRLFRTLLSLRINGMTQEHLSDYFRVPVKTVDSLEKLAVEAVQEAIISRREVGVPIIGG